MLVTAYVHAYVPYHNAGAETTLHDLLRTLVEAGHEAQVVLKESPYAVQREYEYEGVKVVQAKDKRSILHYVPTSDLLITHLECCTRATLLGQKFRVPVAQLVHNNLDITRNYVGMKPDFVIFNTDWIKVDFSDHFGQMPSITVHPPIIAENYRTQHGKKVTLVNLFERKGTDIFYELVERMPEVEFLAVKGGYGEQVIHEFPNLEFMENRADMKAVYGNTKVILMPSVYESYGRVACEALASGIPNIVTPTPGLMEALGPAGIYVGRESVNDWENALRALLKPRRYGALTRLALERSKALDTMAKEELANFVLYCEQFTSLYKRKR
jgi:glycosyltransferase involved in cell wall biosynthesis